jgi:hypothetical protein
VIADCEAVIGDHLRSALSVLAVPVVGRTPNDTDEPWVRVTLLDAPSEGSEADHLVGAYVQLDCFAGRDGGQEEASLIARTVREALRTIAAASHSGATVNGSVIDGYARIPDTEFEPARERFTVTATVYLHA